MNADEESSELARRERDRAIDDATVIDLSGETLTLKEWKLRHRGQSP